jgi:hypothetical protein
MTKGTTTRTTQIKKREFIEILRTSPSITGAAYAVGVGRKTVYEWREKDPEFAEAWQEACEHRTDELEKNLLRIAMEGDVTASIFLLKGYKPEVFRERQDVNMRSEMTGRITVVKLPEKEP